MNINLLPRKSRIQMYFWPILLFVIITYTIIGLVIVFAQYNNNTSNKDANEAISELQMEIESLVLLHQPDPLVEDIHSFQSDITVLKNFRRDWIRIMEEITAILPETSKILNLETNENSELMIDTQFDSIQQIAAMIEILNSSDLFEDVKASSINRALLANTIPGEITEEQIMDSIVPTTVDPTISDINEYIDQLESQITIPQDESEQALNELRWLMEQKTAEDQLGIDIPQVALPDAPDIESWKQSSLFTIEEILSAMQEVERYKALDEQFVEPTPPTEGTIEENNMYIYQTTLVLKLSALDVGKEDLP